MLGSQIPNRNSSASYSLTGRPKTGGFVQNSNTPGANTYKIADPEITGRKAPVFSLYARNYMPGGRAMHSQWFATITLKSFLDATKKPGPGAHSPEKVTISKKSAPAHSMGIRHSEYICPLIIDVSDWTFAAAADTLKIVYLFLGQRCFVYVVL